MFSGTGCCELGLGDYGVDRRSRIATYASLSCAPQYGPGSDNADPVAQFTKKCIPPESHVAFLCDITADRL